MAHFPKKAESIKILLDAAQRAAKVSNGEHPEDLAYAMINALEVTPEVIMKCYKAFGQNK